MTAPVDGPSPAGTDSLQRDLESVGLTYHQAKVLLALLHTGAANSVQLAHLAGVHRTSIYKVMEALTDQGLAEPLPSCGNAFTA